MKIAVAGTGYVGLSIAILLPQHHTDKALFRSYEHHTYKYSRKNNIIKPEKFSSHILSFLQLKLYAIKAVIPHKKY